MTDSISSRKELSVRQPILIERFLQIAQGLSLLAFVAGPPRPQETNCRFTAWLLVLRDEGWLTPVYGTERAPLRSVPGRPPVVEVSAADEIGAALAETGQATLLDGPAN